MALCAAMPRSWKCVKTNQPDDGKRELMMQKYTVIENKISKIFEESADAIVIPVTAATVFIQVLRGEVDCETLLTGLLLRHTVVVVAGIPRFGKDTEPLIIGIIPEPLHVDMYGILFVQLTEVLCQLFQTDLCIRGAAGLDAEHGLIHEPRLKSDTALFRAFRCRNGVDDNSGKSVWIRETFQNFVNDNAFRHITAYREHPVFHADMIAEDRLACLLQDLFPCIVIQHRIAHVIVDEIRGAFDLLVHEDMRIHTFLAETASVFQNGVGIAAFKHRLAAFSADQIRGVHPDLIACVQIHKDHLSFHSAHMSLCALVFTGVPLVVEKSFVSARNAFSPRFLM